MRAARRGLAFGAWAWLALAAVPAWAQAGGDGRPSEDEIFGAPAAGDGEADDPERTQVVPGSEAGRPSEDALFGGDLEEQGAGAGDDARFTTPSTSFALEEDPLTIGGQLYLRLSTIIGEDMDADEIPLSMPNILDVYLDARPDERVRGFFNGRLYFDPTVGDGDTDGFGQTTEQARVLVDQLWLKTDIARAVFLTVGQARIKWGASRIWNPTDFVNVRRREPLALFDERTGVPMIKVHVPIESLGWNVIGLVLLDDVEHLTEVAGAVRLEMAFDAAEVTLSALDGKGRKTSFGADLSAAVGPLDVTAEVSLTDERDSLLYEGAFDPASGQIPTSRERDAWIARFSAGVTYAFKPNDDDVMFIGAEYFYNPLGYDDPGLYPVPLLLGDAQSFYLGRHYAGLLWSIPSPGRWDDASFTLSTVGNLSDLSFVSRLDFSVTLHTRLKLEAYAQVHYGERGGEFRFALDVPDIPAIPGVLEEPIDGFVIRPPLVGLGLNLRISI